MTTRHARQYGGSRLATMLALVVLLGGGVLAYRHFFQRAGEAAINLIPDDALFVATLDTTPSPAQVPAFKQISDALQREQAGTQFDNFVTSLLSNSPIATKLRPYLANSFAGAALKASSSRLTDADWVLLAALKDSGSVHEILEQNATKQALNGQDYYQVGQDRTCMALISDYLVIAAKPQSLGRIAAVHRGEVASVARAQGFQEARATLPVDANLMLFAAPELFKETGNGLAEMNRSVAVSTPFQTDHWLAIGVAVHDGGIDTVLQWPVSPPAGMAGADLSHIAPLDPQLLKKLPSGAYGLMAVSQPGKYWNWIVSAADSSPDAQRSLNDGIAQFERETGMSVPRDVLPGFDGDLMLGVYPDAAGSRHSVDGLIVLDDANGADPAALAAKVRDYITRQSAREGRTPVQFVPEQRPNATIWSLDTASQDQLRHALTGAASSAQNQIGGASSLPSSGSTPPMPPMPNASAAPNQSDNGMGNESSNPGNAINGMNNNSDGANNGADNGVSSGDSSEERGTPQPPPGIPSVQRAIANKTVVYAQVGHAVLIASSQQMLDRALAAYTTAAGTLFDDPAYAQMSRQAPSGAQSLMMIDLPYIMEELRPVITNALSGSRLGITPDDIAGLFGHNTGVICTQRYDGKVIRASFYMPLDYAKYIHLIGAFSQSLHGAAAPMPAPSSPGA